MYLASADFQIAGQQFEEGCFAGAGVALQHGDSCSEGVREVLDDGLFSGVAESDVIADKFHGGGWQMSVGCRDKYDVALGDDEDVVAGVGELYKLLPVFAF